MKSRRPVTFLMSALIALALAVPMFARDVSAKGSKVTTATMDIFSEATLGGTDIKPGTYTFKIDDSTVTVLLHGKMVAQARAEWKDETSKPAMSNLRLDKNQIKEIHFSGKMKYVQVMD
ncbi:MAG TPA: hypothetical protein VMB02_08695 [Candidatus Aquilonibacter sp.]|nr:hypothetical protein [Candidatus Aquilonibacter sp.]